MPGRLEDVVAKFLADNSDTIAKIRQMRQEYEPVAAMMREGIKITADNRAALAAIGEVKTALAGLPDSKEITVTVKYVTVGDKPGAGLGLGADTAEITRHLQDISTYMDMATDSMGRMEEHLGAINRNVNDSSASLHMQTEMLRDNAAAHDAVAVAAGRSASATRDAAAIARDNASANYSNAMAGYLTAKAAAGAFGGGGGGGAGGGGGGFGAGTADAAFATAAGFVRRWYPAVHWAMMLGNEILATVGPAAVAAGTAGLVGYQGGQQIVNRYQALNAVAESLGPSTGQSMATFLGVPNTLQQLQNQYGSGEMYGIAGAGINALRTGAGGGFLQLGQNTLQMLSGAGADFVLSLQKGLGSAAGQIVGGGTHYLQQFGQVAGNIGQTFINAAPYLPGVGATLLSGLQGVTGLARNVTGALGPGLLPILGFEAGARYGPALAGGAGRLLTGIGGAAARSGLAGGGSVIGELLGGGGSMLEGLGLGLGAMTAPEIGLAVAGGLLVQRGLTAQTAAQKQYGALASNLTIPNLAASMGTLATAAYGAGGFQAPPGKFTPLSDQALAAGAPSFGESVKSMAKNFDNMGSQLKNLNFTGVLRDAGNIVDDMIKPGGAIHSLGVMLGLVPPPPDAQQAAFQQLGKAFGTWSNVLGSASQVKDVWKNMGEGALSTANALDVLMQSGVNINTAFQANHQLTAKATQQLKDYVAGYQAMTGTVPGGATGGTLAAINAVTVAGGLQSSKLATTNAALDQIAQITSGGGAGTAALTQLLAAMPALAKGQGAYGNVLTAGGAAAMTAFASTTQPSVISQLASQADWLRTAQVLGAFGGGGATQAGMAKFLIGQALPSAQRLGPMGLADLSTIAQQYGMAPFSPGESAKQMTQAFHQFLQGGDTARQYLAALTGTTVKVSNIPSDARQFITQATGGFAQSLASGIDLYGQGVQQQYMASFARGGPSAALSRQYAGLLGTAGYTPQSAGAMAAYTAHVAGASTAQIQAAAKTITVNVKANVQLSTASVKSQAASLKGLDITGKINYENKLPSAPPTQHGSGVIHYVNQVPHAPVGPTGHGVIIYTAVTQGAVSGLGGTVTGMGRGQHGMLVPGRGSGDIVPAMLEPGELVVPRSMVGSGMVDHLKGRIPGFQGGGVVAPSVAYYPGMGAQLRSALQDFGAGLLADMAQILASMRSAAGTAGGGGYGAPFGSFGGPLPVPAAASKVFDAFEKTFAGMGAPWGRLAGQILTGLEYGIRNAPHETKKMAQALVNQVKSEISYGQGVASAALAGQGFTPSGGAAGLLSTFTGLPQPVTAAGGAPYQYYLDQATVAGGGTVSVQQQMGDYLQAMRSFQADTGTLAKGGLSRGLLRQLFSAGPIAGDQLAQSILSGPGGIKGANQLQAQISAAAKSLGVSAVGDVYGMPKGPGAVGVHADVAAAQAAINGIHGKSVTISVNVALTGAGGGGGGGGGITIGPGGTVELTPAAVKSITSQIQSALLKQAKRNRGTNIRLPGYGG